MRARLVLLVFALVCLMSRVALACPSCFSGVEEAREAFFATFVFLTVTPLIGAGLLIWWLVRRARALELELEADANPS